MYSMLSLEPSEANLHKFALVLFKMNYAKLKVTMDTYHWI